MIRFYFLKLQKEGENADQLVILLSQIEVKWRVQNYKGKTFTLNIHFYRKIASIPKLYLCSLSYRAHMQKLLSYESY